MDFLAVTITDLSDNVKEMTYGSIKSFLKYHKNKLFLNKILITFLLIYIISV